MLRSPYKPSLDSLFMAAKLCLQDCDKLELEQAMREIFKLHGGLSASYQKRYGKHLLPYEMMGYAWEALPAAIEEFDPTRGKATTVWGLIIRRITTYQRDSNVYVGAVKVGIKVRKRFNSVGFDEALKGHIDQDYLMTIDDSAMISSDCRNGSKREGD